MKLISIAKQVGTAPRWFMAVALILSHLSGVARPEPANPFGAPPTSPDRGGDADDDDFSEPGGGDGFGFTPPPDSGSPPPSGDSPSAGSSSGSGKGKTGATAAARPKQTKKTEGLDAKNGKPAPKLTDYLKLDSSVKGLEVKNFDLNDKEIKDVVTLISKWTGKNFILDSKVRGKITVLGPSQVTLQEAYHAFLSALEANGLTTVQSGKYIRIIESAEARRAPVETFAGDYAPKTDQFITRIFQLKYINADEVQREFRDLTTRQGKLFAYEPTNSIIITDTGSNIARIQEILDTLDVKGFEASLHVMRIKNTSARQISDMLGEIYGDDKKGGGSGSRSFRRSSFERTRGGGIISKIIPDEGTNSLVVLANQSGFDQLKILVNKLDTKVTNTGKIHVYYCEYAKAEDLSSTLAALSGSGSGGGGRRSSGRGSSGGGTGAPPALGGGAPAASGGGASSAELDGGVKVTADPPTNSLVITASASDYQTLLRVIKKLDIPRLQVFVETAIIEVAMSKTNQVGVSTATGAPGRGFAGGFVGDSDTLKQFLLTGIPQEGATIPFFAGPSFEATNPLGTGTIQVTTFMGFLKLLTSVATTTVLSTPQIIAMDNEKAEFKVLDETPVQSSLAALGGAAAGGLGGLSGFAQGNIERLKTGIEIKLTPHINASTRTIRMELEQKVDNLKTSADVPEQLAKIQKATTSRVTNTSVVVRDKDFVMLGGLMSDKVDETVKKVPLLGDIPILGWLFKSRTTQVTKSNLIILLRPRIIGTSVTAANLIQERLQARDEFVDKNLGGDDDQKEAIDKLKENVNTQATTPPTFDPLERYRNNAEEEIKEAQVSENIVENPNVFDEDSTAKKGTKNELKATPPAASEGEPKPVAPATAPVPPKSGSASQQLPSNFPTLNREGAPSAPPPATLPSDVGAAPPPSDVSTP